ncbi:MAG TPA: hypothetical protein VIG73_14800 [Cerasibacillus sp.]|uniref:hypothetical protein n=1 Tax=Cerasibacillus sp. TaxID=2498711 RepID=UPI002F3EE107
MNDVQDDQIELSKELEDNHRDIKNEKSPDEIDVLNLPPRSVVHRDHGKTRIKLGKPLLRFLTVVVVIMLLIIVVVRLNII